MIEFLKKISFTTKFSIIAFLIVLTIGLLSIGFLGLSLYYTVSFLFSNYPHIDDWHGDWTWPAIIGIGMGWSFGFLFAGLVWHFLKKIVKSAWLLRFIYVLILWIWNALIWHLVIINNLEKLS